MQIHTEVMSIVALTVQNKRQPARLWCLQSLLGKQCGKWWSSLGFCFYF